MQSPRRIRIRRGAVALATAGALALQLTLAPTASADDYPVGDQAFDVAVLRPLGFLGTVVGFGFFVASLPLSGPTLQVEEAWERFVQAPGAFTFDRALGDF